MNVLLAQLLQERGLVAAPEQIFKHPLRSISLPDVIVDFQGLRLAIECEFGKNGQAQQAAYSSARNRVEQALAHVGIAVVYPGKLRHVAFDRAKGELEKTDLQYAIVTETDIIHQTVQLPLFEREKEKPYFAVGTVDDLADALRRSYEQLVQDETLERAVSLIEAAIHMSLLALRLQPATTIRLAQALGIPADDAEVLKPRGRNAVNRISFLILINAMIFQEVLSQKDHRVKPLEQFRQRENIVSKLRDHWRYILDSINYYPIFHVAHNLLACFSADQSMERAINEPIGAALRIVGWRASLRHDLAGRIYHRLLLEAKYLGAYYTSIPSATLLLKIALPASHHLEDWSDIDELSKLRIADLACGTGTLLMASADVVIDNYVRACVERGKTPEIDILHHKIVEHIIYGYDVQASAIHLTASTLSLRVPDTPINVTHLYRLDLGGEDAMLGTLEFLEREASLGMGFSQPEQITGKEMVKGMIRIPDLDICTMNPPFTSSRRANLLFGNLPQEERTRMQARLRKIVAKEKVPAQVTAGLAAVFVALADRHLRRGGCLALVLPRSIISGVAWEPTRSLLARKYHLEYLIASHAPGHWNFSENTSLSEVLVVARKQEQANNAVTLCVNLWTQPRTAIEALGVARSLIEARGSIASGEVRHIITGGQKFGEAIGVPWSELKTGLWTFPCAFAQSELMRVLNSLREGKLIIPGDKRIFEDLPLCPFGEIAEFGPDPRDVYDGFDLAPSKTAYPALWGHDSTEIETINQIPNQYLEPLTTAKAGRPLRKLDDLWPKASHLLIAQRTRLNTKRVTAVRVTQKVLGDVWCPVLLKNARNITDSEKALALWLNSTLGILIFLGYREETEGAYVQYKKPVLMEMPTLDVRRLGRNMRALLAKTYDDLRERRLEPLSWLSRDVTRAAIDRVISSILNVPDLKPLRDRLGDEPIICGTIQNLFKARGA